MSESPFISPAERLVQIGAKPKRRYIPIDLDSGEIARERRIYCLYYDACLDYAEVEDWVSWSCAQCPIEARISIEEMREQAFEICKVIRGDFGKML